MKSIEVNTKTYCKATGSDLYISGTITIDKGLDTEKLIVVEDEKQPNNTNPLPDVIERVLLQNGYDFGVHGHLFWYLLYENVEYIDNHCYTVQREAVK